MVLPPQGPFVGHQCGKPLQGKQHKIKYPKYLTFPGAFLSRKVFAMLPRAALGLASGFWKNDLPAGRRLILASFSSLAYEWEGGKTSVTEIK